MRITLCGSIAHIDEMVDIKKQLTDLGHKVKTPATFIKNKSGDKIPISSYYRQRQTASDKDGWMWKTKKRLILNHFRRIEWAEAILVVNLEKRGVKNYIGGNTLMEMGLAMFLKKKIFLLNPVPTVSYKEEVLAAGSVIINGDLAECK